MHQTVGDILHALLYGQLLYNHNKLNSIVDSALATAINML